MGSSTIAMPLLSTLAALVIIVHSAEENYERELHMMRPRALEAETTYDQPWRMVDMRPKMTESPHTTPSETWDDTDPELSMRRRRVRKRKRRPHPAEEYDLLPQEGVYTYSEEPQPQLQENIERPRRRRKKMDFQNNDQERLSSWNEEAHRPKKRRGQKRKRPLGDFWPELSEFSGYREPTDSSEETAVNKEIQIDSVHDIDNDNQKDINEKSNMKVQIYNLTEIEKTTPAMMNYDSQPQMVANDEDRSLSEFSIESLMPKEKLNKTIIDLQGKIRDKGIILANNNEPPKDKEPLDPIALKALLKRSNGKSLSEILQQNNLSLADLLHGRQKALSVLNKESLSTTQDIGQFRHSNRDYYNPISSKEKVEILNKSETEEETERLEIETTTFVTTTEHMIIDSTENNHNNEQGDLFKKNHQENDTVDNHRRGYMRRRFPSGIRRKLRTRPTENNTYKGQLSRDLIALTSMKYKNNRNISKSREWKAIIPSMIKTEPSNAEIMQIETETEMITTTPCPFTETTTPVIYETTTDLSYTSINIEPIAEAKDQQENTAESKTTYLEIEGIDIAQFTTSPLDVNTEQEKEITTHKPLSYIKPSTNASDLRRQALNNRLKRKRVKHKSLTTEIPEELEIKDTFGKGKYVSPSQFITKTYTTNTAKEDDFMTLEDYLTTEATQHVPNRYRSKKPMTTKNITAFTIQKAFVTEATAKFEIDEILNDDHTSAKLSKILKERNMTLKELIEHRERGSSHVHLADIFHNASREPNPPEPFLSKSLIEPISKETYPLRALLDANIYDPRTTTMDPSVLQINNANIPVVMDFGNNVNENGENKGILSLFSNYSKTAIADSNSNKGSARRSDDVNDVKTNFSTQGIETTREARMMNSEKDSVTWNDLINLMQKKHQKKNSENDNSLASDIPISETLKKIDLEEDVDGDGVIVLDDLQQISNMEKKTSSEQLLELKLYERNKPPQILNESNVMLSNTKSVTVATASIIGLALILFLLTYAILKWKQQNKIFHTKHAKEDEFVPSPVFESRKGHKIHSSTRSKSPMLATSNIYSIDTLDTHAGSESPEYMWETLRKPFQ